MPALSSAKLENLSSFQNLCPYAHYFSSSLLIRARTRPSIARITSLSRKGKMAASASLSAVIQVMAVRCFVVWENEGNRVGEYT